MTVLFRGFVLTFAVVALLIGASSAYADNFQLTYSGAGLSGTVDLAATPEGAGVFLVTGISGAQNGSSVTGLIAPVTSGLFGLPDGSGFTYDNLLFTSSSPTLDNAGLLFTVAGLSQPVNLYSTGTLSYLESNYVGGGKFPSDFISTSVTLNLVANPEPSTLALCLVGFLILVLTASKKLVG